MSSFRDDSRDEIRELKQAVVDLRQALKGCSNALTEAGKQLRAVNNAGHAQMCDSQVDLARQVLAQTERS